LRITFQFFFKIYYIFFHRMTCTFYVPRICLQVKKPLAFAQGED